MQNQQLQALLDRDDVAALCVEYAAALDAQDWERLRACFASDCKVAIAIPALEIRGVDAVVEQLARTAAAVDGAQHLVSNFRYRVAGARATGSCSFVGVHWRGGGSEMREILALGGVYDDELLRNEGRWIFQRRRIKLRWRFGELDLES